MAAPPLRIPLGLNMQEFERNIERAKGHTAEVTQFIVKRFVDMNVQVLATAGAAGSAAVAVRQLLGALGPISVAAAGIVAVFRLMGYATDLAREKIEEFNEIAKEAAQSGLSTDFFQRLTKSGEQLKLTIEEAGEALQRFNNQAQDRLGGSFLQQRVGDLTGAGNFAGNAGVGQLAGAVGSEEKLRAIVALISDAIDKGERLAAIDLAEKAFGPKVADNLRANSNFLREMLDNADKLAATKIISDEQLGAAINLKTQLEEAQKTLAEKFKPIQDDLAKLGMDYEASWVNIYRNLAAAVTVANQLYDALKAIPGVLRDAGNSSFWDRLTQLSGAAGLNSRPEGLVTRGEEGFGGNTAPDSPATRALRAGLSNPLAVQQAMRQATEVDFAVRRDQSRPTGGRSDVTEERRQAFDQVQRYTNALQKAGEVAQAELDTLGLSNEARARAVALAEAQAAARARGRPLDDAEVAAIERYATALSGLQDRLNASRPLVQFARDAQDVNKALAETAVGGLRSFEDSIVGIIRGTESVSEAFTRMADAILEDLARIAIRQAITGPIAGALGGLLGGGGTGGGIGGWLAGAFSSSDGLTFGGPRAEGGPVRPGSWYMVGERGPEPFVPTTPGVVLPNSMMRNGSPQVTVNLVEDQSRAGQTESRSRDDGGASLTVFVDRISARNLSTPGSASHNAIGQFGRLARR